MKKFFFSLIAIALSALNVNAEGFKITSSDPAAGECAGIAKGSYWKFSTNMDDDANFVAIKYEFYDATTKSSLYSTVATKSDKYVAADGMWEIKNYSAALSDFKQGHKIMLTITALDNVSPGLAQTIGMDSVVYIGAGTSEYVYSPVKLVSITPEAGTEIKSKDNNTFVLTFSEGVRLNKTNTLIVTGQMSTASFQSITANADSTIWTLVAKQSTIESTSPELDINVYATDINGLTLEGNGAAYRLESKSYYKFIYQCYLGSPSMTVEPAAGVVTSLKDFKLSYSGGMNFSYAAGLDSITVTNEAGDIVAMISAMQDDGAVQVDKEKNAFVTFSLPTAITTPGKYLLTIPSKAFALGTEYNGYTSKLQTVAYVIQGSALSATITPATGTELAAMPNISVAFSNADAVGYANYVITDLNPDDPDNPIIMSGDFKKQSDGTWATKYLSMYDIKLYKGHSYKIEVKAYADEMDYNYGNAPMATFSSIVKGTTVPFVYSAVELVSVAPAEYSTITTGDITLTFSGAVATVNAEVNGGNFGTSTSCDVVAGNDGNKTWKITIPESVINTSTGSININVHVQDMEGLYIKGNLGGDSDTTTVLAFNCYNGCPAPETIEPESGSTLDTLSTITLSDSKGINLSYCASSDITVTKGNEMICTVPMSSVTVENAALGKASTRCTITLPNEITETGSYQVNIPALYFILGEQLETVMTKAMTLEYTIAGASKKGDVNSDGKVDISDVNAVIAVICNSLPEGEGWREASDVNGDSKVDISDVNAIINEICGN